MKFTRLSLILLLTSLGLAMPVSAQFRPDQPDFYEEGQRQLEREIERLNQKPSDDVLTVEDEKSKWQEFIQTQGKFTVLMPGVPTEQTDILETPAGNLEFKEFVTERPTSKFVVAYSDYAATAQLGNPQAVLANVRDSLVKRIGGRLLSERPTGLNIYPGTEIKLEVSAQTLTLRLFLVERRLYIVGAGQQNPGEPSEEIAKFFNSFGLLPKSP